MSKSKQNSSSSYEAIKDLVLFAKEQGLSKLKIKDKNSRICIEFPYATTPIPSLVSYAAPTPTVTPIPAAGPKESFHEVKSPFVGTFYLSSAPGKPPFVKVGDKVKKGQVLCIVEAMKIMNQIESDAQGEIVEICCENENLVEYNQVLFRIRAQ